MREGSRRWRRRRWRRRGKGWPKVRSASTKEGDKKPTGGGFGGKRHGPRTRKRDSRKLKGGHGRLVVFKKAICGLEIRPIYYDATATGGGR